MIFDIVNPPPCICDGAPSLWSSSSEQPFSRMIVNQFSCLMCGRPGFLVVHEGGTVFVTPKQQLVNCWPGTTAQYLQDTLITYLGSNADNIGRHRVAIEYSHMLWCLKQVGGNAGSVMSTFPQSIQDKYFTLFQAVYSQKRWLTPGGFEPSPKGSEVPQTLRLLMLREQKGCPVWVLISNEQKTPPRGR